MTKKQKKQNEVHSYAHSPDINIQVCNRHGFSTHMVHMDHKPLCGSAIPAKRGELLFPGCRSIHSHSQNRHRLPIRKPWNLCFPTCATSLWEAQYAMPFAWNILNVPSLQPVNSYHSSLWCPFYTPQPWSSPPKSLTVWG